MPQYRITAPDGQAFIVNAPEGATQDQVLEYAKSQWSKGAAQKSAPKPALEDPGFAQSMLIGAGRTFDRLGKGAQQLYYGATGNDAELAKLKQQASDDDAAYKPLQEARPWATGIGESLPAVALPGGGAKTLLGNAGRMALAGSLPGALEYGSVDERVKRALVGGAAGAAIPIAGAAVKTAKSVLEPLYAAGRDTIAGRTLSRAAGDSAPDVAQRLAAAAELVPGSAPTAAQVANSGGIAALERAAAAANPEAYTRRAMEQASARTNALRGIAGHDAQMAAAVAARKSASDALYSAADAGIAPIDGIFKGLTMRPQFQSAVARAQELAKNSGLEDIFFRDSKGSPVALIGQGAHFIKKALDEAAEAGASSYTGKAGAKAARETNDVFQTWLEKSIPEYAAAKAAFAEKSVPINRMEIGQALMNKAAPALADFGALGRETAATYATALRNGDALAAKATGFPGAKMESVLAPDQMATVTAVAQDLARKANAQDLGRGVGSDTFQKLAMNNIAAQSGMPRAVGGLLDLPGVSRATSWIYRDSDQKMQGLLADALLDPKKAADLMTKADKRMLQNNPQIRQLLEQAIVRGGGLLGLSASAQAAQ